MKRTAATELIIEGPRRDSFERVRPGSSGSSKRSFRRPRATDFIDEADEDEEYDLGERRYHNNNNNGNSRSGSRSGSRNGSRLGWHHRHNESLESLDVEAWPRGIIKTVSVEVVEEVNPDHHHGGGHGHGQQHQRHQYDGNNGNSHSRGGSNGGGGGGIGSILGRAVSRSGVDNAERVSGGSAVEQDWETMLRQGPPGGHR
jgi:hypothetical protein